MSTSPNPRGGGLASWSIGHPVGVTMIALAIVVLGLFSVGRLAVDLLPHIIYPQVNIRILDPGVPANIMEDEVTRQLEEQLAITEDAVGVVSTSSEGNTLVELMFEYGKDIDIALRDASTRLDRAKRFLPDTILPPIIYKRDPSQIPVAEFVISSPVRDPVALRDWVDYEFAKQFLNLPGVAAVEVGGGLIREIQVLPKPERLAAVGLGFEDVVETLQRANVEMPAGRLLMKERELSGRTAARLGSVEDIAALPLALRDGATVRLDEVAQVLDSHGDERIRVRLNGTPGVKISIQKQPTANTVAVVDGVYGRMEWLRSQGLIDEDVTIRSVSDQSVYVRNALDDATLAALSGSFLAMAVTYLFLGNLRRTLLIGSAIPIAMMVTFVLMGAADLTFNIMTLGGLALGIGMLLDNTIVMLENIYRHQRRGETGEAAGRAAASEINSAIVASTTTNLAAVLPFLFIGGLVGLLFRELIFTISAAILASMVVALTLVPALAVRIGGSTTGRVRAAIDRVMERLQNVYARAVGGLLRRAWLQLAMAVALIASLGWAAPTFLGAEQQFLPDMDDGQIMVRVTADPGVSVDEMDRMTHVLETIFQGQPEVESVYSIVGGSIFGRSQREISNRTMTIVQLVPRDRRNVSSKEWIGRVRGEVSAAELAGVRVHMRPRGIRGIRIGRSEEEFSLRIQGEDLGTLTRAADEVVARLKGSNGQGPGLPGLKDISHSAEELRQELKVIINRVRAADLGLDAETIGQTVRRALDGEIVTDFLDGDRSYDVRLRLPRPAVDNPRSVEELILYADGPQKSYRLADVARIELAAAPAEVMRENQRRIVEITGSIGEGATLGAVYEEARRRLADYQLPKGYAFYEGGELEALQEGQATSMRLLGLAVFLVFVVMAVQYESLRNPLLILFSVPFATVGVAVGLGVTGLPLSMPVWLGMIMLAGIVVNNAIVLVEYIEIARSRGKGREEAITEAARLRLRPILMTTLTTVFGMLPLAAGVGEGAEMLQPLAVAIISGLLFSLLVTLVLIPLLYRVMHPQTA